MKTSDVPDQSPQNDDVIGDRLTDWGYLLVTSPCDDDQWGPEATKTCRVVNGTVGEACQEMTRMWCRIMAGVDPACISFQSIDDCAHQHETVVKRVGVENDPRFVNQHADPTEELAPEATFPWFLTDYRNASDASQPLDHNGDVASGEWVCKRYDAFSDPSCASTDLSINALYGEFIKEATRRAAEEAHKDDLRARGEEQLHKYEAHLASQREHQIMLAEAEMEKQDRMGLAQERQQGKLLEDAETDLYLAHEAARSHHSIIVGRMNRAHHLEQQRLKTFQRNAANRTENEASHYGEELAAEAALLYDLESGPLGAEAAEEDADATAYKVLEQAIARSKVTLELHGNTTESLLEDMASVHRDLVDFSKTYVQGNTPRSGGDPYDIDDDASSGHSHHIVWDAIATAFEDAIEEAHEEERATASAVEKLYSTDVHDTRIKFREDMHAFVAALTSASTAIKTQAHDASDAAGDQAHDTIARIRKETADAAEAANRRLDAMRAEMGARQQADARALSEAKLTVSQEKQAARAELDAQNKGLKADELAAVKRVNEAARQAAATAAAQLQAAKESNGHALESLREELGAAEKTNKQRADSTSLQYGAAGALGGYLVGGALGRDNDGSSVPYFGGSYSDYLGDWWDAQGH